MAKKILQSYDFAGNQIIGARMENLASFPAAGNAGRLVLNSTTALIGFDNGTAFRSLAPLDSPAFTGNPTVPTQSGGDNSTKIASTAYVDAAVTAGSVPDNGVTNAKLADMVTARIKGRATAGTGDPEDLTAAQVKTILAIAAADVSGLATVATSGSAADLTGTLAAARLPAFGSGDVSFATGGGAGTIAAGAVTLAKMANIATDSLIGRDTASTGVPEAIGVTGGIEFSGAGSIRTSAFTGDVTKTAGGTALTIANSAVTNAKMANMAANTFKGNNTGSAAAPADLTVAQAKTLLAMAIADVSGLQTALDGKAATSHTHTAANITDFATAVNTQIVAYWDTIAGTDANVDTIREVLDLILSHSSDIANQIGRHNATIGDGTATSIAVTHGLNSNDITVEVYDIGTGETVSVGVTRTSVNIVTIEAFPAPATNSLRVVVKK